MAATTARGANNASSPRLAAEDHGSDGHRHPDHPQLRPQVGQPRGRPVGDFRTGYRCSPQEKANEAQPIRVQQEGERRKQQRKQDRPLSGGECRPPGARLSRRVDQADRAPDHQDADPRQYAAVRIGPDGQDGRHARRGRYLPRRRSEEASARPARASTLSIKSNRSANRRYVKTCGRAFSTPGRSSRANTARMAPAPYGSIPRPTSRVKSNARISSARERSSATIPAGPARVCTRRPARARRATRG